MLFRSIWAYLGPLDVMPEMPHLEHLLVPASRHYVSKRIQHCHWTQGMEGDLDPSHIAHLHANAFAGRAAVQDVRSNDWIREGLSPVVEIVEKPAGILFAARRDAGDDHYFWRVAQWFLPCFTTIPAHPGDGPLFGAAQVSHTCDERAWLAPAEASLP